MDWIPCARELLKEGKAVLTKICDRDGCRNEQQLVRQGRLWFFPGMSMYVYYVPTHWRECPPARQ